MKNLEKRLAEIQSSETEHALFVKESRQYWKPANQLRPKEEVLVLFGEESPNDARKEMFFVDEVTDGAPRLALPIGTREVRWEHSFSAGRPVMLDSEWFLQSRGKVIYKHDLKTILKKMDKKGSVIKKVDLSHLDPLVLESDVKMEIVSVLKQFSNGNKIFEEWGLSEVLEYGRAMSLLFFGVPGTGKTFAANCIAKSLGMELLIISSAEIETSEPGGANRAIQSAFQQAGKNAVLFFDECDSLITRRQDVGMIIGSQINSLLTEIEKFEGVVILSTNRIDSLDEALERRISLIVEFPEPDVEARRNIWRGMLPEKMPLAKDVNVEKLAAFEITGGYIKNIILNAARYAAGDDATEVSWDHFKKAVRRTVEMKGRMGKQDPARFKANYQKVTERG